MQIRTVTLALDQGICVPLLFGRNRVRKTARKVTAECRYKVRVSLRSQFMRKWSFKAENVEVRDVESTLACAGEARTDGRLAPGAPKTSGLIVWKFL